MAPKPISKRSPDTAPARIIAAVLRLWPGCWSHLPSRPTRAELGQWGERHAARFLRARGYRILRTNFRAPRGGEADIVARDIVADTLCFIEVKTRLVEDAARPARTVTPAKQRLILRAALAWLRLLQHPDIIFRFDIVEVIARPSGAMPPSGGAMPLAASEEWEWDTPPGQWPRIRLLKNAFTPPRNFYY